MPILTIAQLKEHIPGLTLADAALQRLLDGAEQSIVQWAGPTGSVTELHDGGGGTLYLRRRASAIGTITESLDTTPLVLAANDFRLLANGYVVERLATGTNQRSTWPGRVQVVLTAADDTSTRQRAQVALVKLDLGYSGFEADNAPAFSRPTAYYEERRHEVLAGLRPPTFLVV